MRRELLVWSKDCTESICEFEGMLSSSPSSRNDRSCSDEDEDEEDDGMEESYAESEMAVARASVNVMKCSKNVLGLILAACECVGERADTYSMPSPADIRDDGVDAASTTTTALRYVTDLQGMARSVGEGVTDLGVLLYPPLDFSASPSTTATASTDDRREGGTADDGGGDYDRVGVVPRLGRTALCAPF
jgi:hypothetical protein